METMNWLTYDQSQPFKGATWKNNNNLPAKAVYKFIAQNCVPEISGVKQTEQIHCFRNLIVAHLSAMFNLKTECKESIGKWLQIESNGGKNQIEFFH